MGVVMIYKIVAGIDERDSEEFTVIASSVEDAECKAIDEWKDGADYLDEESKNGCIVFSVYEKIK